MRPRLMGGRLRNLRSDLDDFGVGCAPADTADAVVPARFRVVVLAGADHLVIGGFEIESKLAG